MTVDLTERAAQALGRAHEFLTRLPGDREPAAVVAHRAGLLICETVCPYLPRSRPPTQPPAIPFAGADEPLRRLAARRGQDLAGDIPDTAPDDMPAWALGLLRADPGMLAGLAERAALDSLWGCNIAALGSRERAGWSTALPVAVTLAVQERDLAIAAALIRAAGYLRLSGHPIITGATAFLISQQQRDGGLGGPLTAQPHLELSVRLPLTVSFVWTLAELTQPGFTARVMNGEITTESP